MRVDCREDPCGECRYCRFEREAREAELPTEAEERWLLLDSVIPSDKGDDR